MPTTITSISTDANTLYTALAGDLTVNLALPELVVPTDFVVPNTVLPVVAPLTNESVTTGTVDGTGIFDVMMRAVNAQMTEQYSKNRITGSDYAKSYVAAITAVMQFGVQFVLARDRAQLENLQLLEAIKLSEVQTVKAQAELQLVRLQIQTAYYQTAEMRIKAYTARNEYATSKMGLMLGYNNILDAESKQKLTQAQFENAYAQVHNLLPDGSAIGGVTASELTLKTKQGLLIAEQYETARGQNRDTLSTGEAFAGLMAEQKLTAALNRQLVSEQLDTQRASTKETLQDGSAVAGLVAKEKLLKDWQGKLVMEQYESQRGQTRGTLSTGEAVVGILGTQVRLYEEQITSYKRDAESKATKMLLDTWVARKTIDQGVAVPVGIDTAALDSAITKYRANLTL